MAEVCYGSISRLSDLFNFSFFAHKKEKQKPLAKNDFLHTKRKNKNLWQRMISRRVKWICILLANFIVFSIRIIHILL